MPGPHGCKTRPQRARAWRTRAGPGHRATTPESRAVLSTRPLACAQPRAHVGTAPSRDSDPGACPLGPWFSCDLSEDAGAWCLQAVEAGVAPLALPFPAAPPSCPALVHLLWLIRLAAPSCSVCGASHWTWSPGQGAEPAELGQPPQTARLSGCGHSLSRRRSRSWAWRTAGRGAMGGYRGADQRLPGAAGVRGAQQTSPGWASWERAGLTHSESRSEPLSALLR